MILVLILLSLPVWRWLFGARKYRQRHPVVNPPVSRNREPTRAQLAGPDWEQDVPWVTRGV